MAKHGKKALTLDGDVERVPRLHQSSLLKVAGRRHHASTKTNLHTRWAHATIRQPARRAHVLIEQVLELRLLAFETRRIGVGEVVCDGIELGLLGDHARGGNIKGTEHLP